jgi:hypothetical protein
VGAGDVGNLSAVPAALPGVSTAQGTRGLPPILAWTREGGSVPREARPFVSSVEGVAEAVVGVNRMVTGISWQLLIHCERLLSR